MKKIKIQSILFLMFFMLALSSLQAYGSNYYVATNGSDSNPGTESQPYRTIQQAADTMVAGDTVYIRVGAYNESVYTMNSGNASDSYIMFSAYLGEKPVIDGTGVDASNGFIINQNYIKLIGLEVRNWNDNAILVENAAYFEISD